MQLSVRRWTLLFGTTGALLTSACVDATTVTAPELAAARMAETPPPPPLDDDAFFPGLGGGGLTYNCTDQLPPEPGTYAQGLGLRASLRMLVAKPGSFAVLRLSSPAVVPNAPNMTISNGAFVQERNGTIVLGKGKVELHPYGSRSVPLYGDFAEATGYLTAITLYNGQPARTVFVTVPIYRADGTRYVEECAGSRIETTSAQLTLLY